MDTDQTQAAPSPIVPIPRPSLVSKLLKLIGIGTQVRYIYFIAFSNTWGTGNIEVSRQDRIVGIEDIREVEVAIKNYLRAEDIRIINYKFMRKQYN